MPTASSLEIAMRVPLLAMRDIDFPRTNEGALDVDLAQDALRDAAALWLLGEATFFENGRALTNATIRAVVASAPSDHAFDSAPTAFAKLSGRPRMAALIPWEQANLEVRFSYPIDAQDSRFSLRSAWSRLGVETITTITVVPPQGDEHTLHFSGNPGLVHLQPSWWTAMGMFSKLGFEYLLDGWDHLLLVLCLVLPVRGRRKLLVVLISFVASFTLSLSVIGLDLVPTPMWFTPFIETGIAMSILYLALENAAGFNIRRRWITAFVMGHFVGFAAGDDLVGLLQFGAGQKLGALLAYHMGGALALLLVAVPAALGFHWASGLAHWQRVVIVMSLVVGHSAWHWLAERFAVFSLYTLNMPGWSSQAGVDVLRWLTFIVTVVFVYRLLAGLPHHVNPR